jgi:hypothetical protein
LDKYPWTGHQIIIEKEKNKGMDTGHVLAQFGETRRQAIREYRRFMTEGLTMGKQPELTGGGLIRSLGGWSQVGYRIGGRGSGKKRMSGYWAAETL